MTRTKSVILFYFRSTGICILLLLALAMASPILAQPVLSAQNTGLGTGGTAYLTGYEAAFWNPANLMIHDHYGQIHVGLGHTGIMYEPVLSSAAAGDQYFNFTDSFYPYRPGVAQITSAQRDIILKDNYPRNSLISQHQTRGDIMLGGALWQRGDEAFSFAARARFASRIDVGRGWYSSNFVPSGDDEVRDFTLTHQKSYFYEFSFGYAREFTFINGLIPRLSKLYVGIAPKFILAGPSVNVQYHGQYVRTNSGNSNVYVSDFLYRSTGQFTNMTSDYMVSSDPQKSIDNNLSRRFTLQNSGFGMGIDFGLTYLIPLGDDISTISDPSNPETVSKSLRVALSINDIGMVRYTKDPLTLSSEEDTVQRAQQQPMDMMFIGADGQFLSYFDSANSLQNPFKNAHKTSEQQYSTLLPTSINAGVLVELSRIKLMGDLTLGLNNTAFTTTKLALHLGLEARPVPQVPIRFGTRLAAGLPTHLGIGTGIETKHWDFNIGGQVIIRSRTLTSEFVGGAFAGLQFHF